VRRSLILLTFVLCALPSQAIADTPTQLGPAALQRYFNGTSATHWVTTGPTSAGYAYEFGLGYLKPGGGPGMLALYSCLSGAEDHFLSFDPACEGRTSLGRIGYSYAAPPAGRESVPIFRCIVGGRPDHFASNDPGCEGQTKELALGYALRRSDALLRFWVPSTGTHAVTAGDPPAGATYEFGLGFLLAEGGGGRHALYGCDSGGADWFLSLDPGCEGRTVHGLEGYAYDAPPTAEATQAVYRCQWPGHDHFASSSSDCEGQHTEGNLGYLRTYGEALHLYGNPANGISWTTPGAVTAGFFYQRTLGFLAQTGGPNLQALYGCRTTGGDYFLSLDGTCEGVGVLGRYGFVYVAPPTGEDTVAVYRCLRDGQRHFASLDPACSGATTEARLGYLRTAEGGAPPPPACSPSAARLQIGLGKLLTRTIRYGGTATLSGVALNPDGAPAAGATVLILEGDSSLVEISRVVAGADGRFSYRVPAGVNRTLRTGFRAAASDVALACSNTVALRVKAGVTLRAKPRSVRFGRTTRFSGQVLGAGLPARGKLVDLQAFEGRWRTFKTVRTSPSGGFSARYRFIRVNRTRTLKFRARVRREAGFPYQLGTSKTTKVRIRARR
jgi:hypothetical protein